MWAPCWVKLIGIQTSALDWLASHLAQQCFIVCCSRNPPATQWMWLKKSLFFTFSPDKIFENMEMMRVYVKLKEIHQFLNIHHHWNPTGLCSRPSLSSVLAQHPVLPGNASHFGSRVLSNCRFADDIWPCPKLGVFTCLNEWKDLAEIDRVEFHYDLILVHMRRFELLEDQFEKWIINRKT